MRRKIEILAETLPAALNLGLLASVSTLLLVNATDSWLLWFFVGWLREFEGAAGPAGSAAFCRFMLTAVFLYLLCLGAAGLATAAVLSAVIKWLWHLAGR